MGQQPPAHIKGFKLQAGELKKVAAEHLFQRQATHRLIVKSPGAVTRRSANRHATVAIEDWVREEFGETFDQPSWERPIRVLKHQMVGIFVEEDGVGAEIVGASLAMMWNERD